MFEKLDGVFSVDVITQHMVGFSEYDITNVRINYVDSFKVITFDGLNQSYYANDNIKAEEHEAIGKQMKELGWL